jgi:serralysin
MPGIARTFAATGSEATVTSASAGEFAAITAAPTPQPGAAGPNVGATQGLTGNAFADGVLGGSRWGNLSLTYSFPTLASQYEAEITHAQNNFSAAQAGLQTATIWALTHLTQFTNMTVSLAGNAATADLRTAISGQPATAEAYYPGDYTAAGDIWYGAQRPSFQTPQYGNYDWFTVLHEVGHALGLKHGHQTEGAFPVLPTQFDQMAYSLMTYRSFQGADFNGGATNEEWGFTQSFMMADIIALQYMYGANYNTNSGNTTYTWSATTGQMSINGAGQLTPGGNRIFLTVWDGGGTDTYDFSNYTTNLQVNLAPGEFTITSEEQRANLGSNNFAPGNIFNSLLFNNDTRSLIENATGGSGNDTIIGNAVANLLIGNGGTDTLSGADGDDTFDGGAAVDTINGGNGTDTVTYANDGAGVTIRLDLGFGVDGGGANDTYTSIENVIGTALGDVLVGLGGVANRLDGGDGNDTIYGEGADTLIGGAGTDTLFGGSGGALTLNLAVAGFETVWTSAGTDNIDGSGVAVALTLIGQGAGGDTLTGGSNADFVYFRNGDVIQGNAGSDWAVATLSPTGVTVNLTATGFENSWGSTSGDTITGAGATGAVVIVGDTGDDQITGGDQADFLYGFGDADTIIGGLGNDQILGGTGNDVFRYNAAAFGTDTIWDFAAGDRINMAGTGVNAFGELTIAISGAHSVITSAATGASTIWVLNNVALGAGDFLFA